MLHIQTTGTERGWSDRGASALLLAVMLGLRHNRGNTVVAVAAKREGDQGDALFAVGGSLGLLDFLHAG